MSLSFIYAHDILIFAACRLETRVGSEDVIERLHGRMVRGWNDPGSRISVRFADTSEQRELRVSLLCQSLIADLSILMDFGPGI